MKLSLVIPAKDKNDPKLAQLLKSIEAQDFPKDEMEVLVITEGTSESAKAIGIRKAKGEVIGILASDNFLPCSNIFKGAMLHFPVIDALWSFRYHYDQKRQDILNRYFALIGGNDPLSFYMGKNDRVSYLRNFDGIEDFDDAGKLRGFPSIGDNGFFIKRCLILKTDLDNYYHVDNALEALYRSRGKVGYLNLGIEHNTGGNIFKFFAKRYRYGLQHAFNPNRRWHLVEKTPRDIGRLLWFIFVSLTLLQPLSLSIRGYLKIRDVAWFLHPLICILTLFTYGLLVTRIIFSRLFQSLFAPMAAQKA